MQKIACIFSFKESNWVSCQKIVFNLHKSYELSPGLKLENFNYPHELTDLDAVAETAKKILQFDPDVISILDHKPHPVTLFQHLAPLYKNRKKPRIIFHLFGDFTIYYQNWEMMETILEDYPVEFVVASERQKILVDKMFKNNPAVVCPFPVNPKEFYFSEELRQKQRQEWGLAEDAVAFLFTGRLSKQKRIRTLISTFAEALGEKPNAHLFLYGHQDSLGDPFFGKFEIEGEYFRKFYATYRSLPESIQQRIHFMGAVPNAKLLSVYGGADVLTNLSVHNDEDYGMSVAEAQFTGLPSILTDWGGLAGFANPQVVEGTHYIPVKIAPTCKSIDRKAVIQALKDFYVNPRRSLRTRIAQAAAERLSLAASAGVIRKMLDQKSEPFNGFTDLFKQASFAQSIAPYKWMYLDKYQNVNNLYKKIYSSYVRSH
jgi:glycosyltransferase involved in cell wall biosynthesis